MKLFKTEAEVIEEIHQDFDSAQCRLLESANRILAEIKVPEVGNTSVAERLERLGFAQAAQVREVKDKVTNATSVEGVKKTIESNAKIISYYKEKYPFLKFLTIEELDRLCAKWNLIYAPISKYKEAVPVKNIQDIEKAQSLLSGDMSGDCFVISVDTNYTGESTRKRTKSFIEKFIKKGYLFSEEIETMYASTGKTTYRGHARLNGYIENMLNEFARANSYSGISLSISVDSSMNKLHIAAPKDHFDLTGMSTKGKYGFAFLTPIPKDPIVFRYVRGGIQVITKWGLEASDPLLCNPIDN